MDLQMCKKENCSSSQMVEDLPENIVEEILVRLPLNSLFASKCVCKTFLNLTSPNPHFIELHSKNATQSLIFQFAEEDFRPSPRIRLLEPELLKFDFRPFFQVPEYSSSTEFVHVEGMGRVNYINKENEFFLINSCNGLLYFVRVGSLDECSLVCNPVTNEYMWVIIGETGESVTRSQWLGFGATSNKYKVLRISTTQEGLGCVAHILELGSEWCRIIEKPPLGRDHTWNSPFTLVEGFIYWYDASRHIIVSFDFDKEIFEEISMPTLEHLTYISIGDLGGRLALSCNDVLGRTVDIWVVEKRGNQQFWSKKIVVDTLTTSRRLFVGHFKPLQILRNGELLMIWKSNDLVLYNPRNKRLRFVGLRQNLDPMVVLFRPSFVSLKDALMIDNVGVQTMRPRSYECDRIRGGQPNFNRGSLDDGFLSL